MENKNNKENVCSNTIIRLDHCDPKNKDIPN